MPIYSTDVITELITYKAASKPRLDAWVPGHWLAMLPVVGIGIGYFVAPWGYTLAYICLWLAFIHFVVRGVQQMRAARPEA